MGCCGSKRAMMPPPPSPAPVRPGAGIQPSPARPPPPRLPAQALPPTAARVVPRSAPAAVGILFEYVGATGMTVIGPATGRRYRFDRPGATVSVDPRDAPALTAVPRVRRA